MLKDFLLQKPTLLTQRLIIRPLLPTDANDLRQWTPSKTLYRYWGKLAGRADKDPSLLFSQTAKPTKSFHWGIALRENNQIVGEIWVYLIEGNRMAKLALRIAESQHGRGIGTEATLRVIDFCFAQTELQRLWTDVDVRNEPSVRVLQKCGFTREGLIRQGKMVSTWCDYYLYALLRSDYETRKIMTP